MIFLLTGLMMSAVLAADSGPGFSGASVFFTSPEPPVQRARVLVGEGRLREAEALLGQLEAADPARAEGLEIIRRMRQDYSLTRDELVRKLHNTIPQVSPADVDRWRAAGELQARTLDGQVLYFRREPSNLFRFCPDAIERRRAAGNAAAPSSSSARLAEHLRSIIAAAGTSDSPMVLPIRHRVRYRVTVAADRPGARAGSLVRCWLPYPQAFRQQGDIRLIRTQPEAHRIAPNGLIRRGGGGEPEPAGARPGGASPVDDQASGLTVRPEAQRTLYLETTINDPAKPVVFEEEFEYVCSAYYPRLDDERARPLERTDLAVYLQERPPHIRFSPLLRDTVRQVVGDEANPLRCVRRIFHHIDSTIRYCAEEEYTIIPSFSEKALTSRKGDCGIQSTLFITMCRAAGVPARWQSGWETKPWGFNMHDWAEFYVEPWGWLPADMSYGLQVSDDPAIREFYIGHLDSYRMIVNLDYGCPLMPVKTSLRSEPADFQRGEIEIDGRNLYFDEWDYDIQFAWK